MIELKNSSKEKGITLIALVITIIVMLILVGVSITMLTGNNSILTKAGEAKNRTKETGIIENISLAYNSGKIEKYVGTKSLSETMEEELAKIYGEDNVEVNDNGDNTYTVTINSEEYNIEDGKVEKAGPVVNPYDPDGWGVAWVYPTTDGNWSDEITEKSALPQNYEIIAKLYEVNEGNINYSLVIEGQGEIKDLVDASDQENMKAFAWQGKTLKDPFIFQDNNNNKVRAIICDGITGIGDYAFGLCSSLTNIKIPDSVTSIGKGVFVNCSGLTSIIIPDSITSIGESAFGGCTGLTSIIIPDSITSIGEGTFTNCTGLTSIIIPDSVTSIGDHAFAGCSNIKYIKISNKIENLDIVTWFDENYHLIDEYTSDSMRVEWNGNYFYYEYSTIAS